jgi:hydroxymethylbilane synthase
MTKSTIVIGTRGSKLALYQAEQVKMQLETVHPDLTVEIKIIKTKGDEILDVALSKIGDKGLFTKELENAMLAHEVDMAVHSLKDLQTDLSDNLMLAAVLERANFRDALVSKNGKKLSELTASDTIATSSLRRKAGLLNVNKNFHIIDIRGNVHTRLRKMEEGYCDAIIMAAAGLQRLGLDNYITEILEPEILIPAVSQGVIAIETRRDDISTNQRVHAINHSKTWIAITAERAFMRALQGGCQIPVGCYTKIDDKSISITGFVSSVDGCHYIREEKKASVEDAELLGIQLANALLSKGGDLILKEIRSNL